MLYTNTFGVWERLYIMYTTVPPSTHSTVTSISFVFRNSVRMVNSGQQKAVIYLFSISVFVCAGPVCEMDEVFLESAYKLLQIILETNALTGKHMLLCESGEHILSLFEVLYLFRYYKHRTFSLKIKYNRKKTLAKLKFHFRGCCQQSVNKKYFFLHKVINH